MFIDQPFDQLLKLTYDMQKDGTLQVHMPIQDFFINSMHVIHEGIIFKFDYITTSNLIPANEDGKQQAVTIDLNTSFLKPAAGTYLTAHATLEKAGRTLIHARCAIFDDNQKQVASSTAILYRT